MAFFTRKLLLSFSLSLIMVLSASVATSQTNALNFDGVNDKVTLGNDTALNGLVNQITIESWIKPEAGGTNVQTVVSKSSRDVNNGYIFPRTNDNWNKLVFYLNFNSSGWQGVEVNYTGTVGQWAHVAATYDGSYMRIYINGALAGERAFSGTISVNNNPLTIGYHTGFVGAESEYYKGSIDELRIWNRALSQCEILNNKNCELAIAGQTGLTALYRFNRGTANGNNTSVTTLPNEILTGSAGTLTNFALAGTTSNWVEGIASGTCAPFVQPNVTITTNGGPSYQTGTPIELTASGGVSYSWTGPGTITNPNQQTLSFSSANSSNNGTYTVTATTASGCQIKASVVVQVSSAARAIDFDGINDIITIPNSPSLNTGTGLTIEAWIKPTDRTTPIQSVINKSAFASPGYIFPRTDDAWKSISFYVHLENQGWKIARVNNYPTDNNWHHVAATFDGFKLRVYVDGDLKTTEEFAGTISRNNNALSIGSQPGITEFYKGGLDEVRVWDRALDKCEILNNISCQLSMPQTGLVAYYQLNQGLTNVNNSAVTSVIDASGNNNSGVLNGFALNGNTSNWISGRVNNVSCAPFTAPTVTATVNGSLLEVGNTLQLTASAQGAASYSWTGPNNFTSNQQNPSIPNAQILNSGTYIVTAEVEGCTPLASVNVTVANKGGTLSLDGVDDVLTHSNNAAFNIRNQITLESWIYPTDNQRQIQSVMGKSARGALNVNNTGYIFPRTDNAWGSLSFYLHLNGQWKILTATGYPGINQWHHVAATYDGFYMRIYIDGVLKASQEASGTITQNTNAFTIGNQPEFTEYYRGKIDEAKVWSRALNQCEIINNMNCELQPAQNNLVAYYKFNQGFANIANTETSVVDASGNNHHLALNNFAQSGTLSNWSDNKVMGTCSTYAEPPVTAQANGSIFGIGGTIRLFANGGTAYTWSGPNDFTSTAPGPILYNAQTINTGTYTVAVPFVNCEILKSVRVSVTQLPAIQASGNTTICPSNKVTLSIATAGTAYQWYLNDEPIAGATASTYEAGATGSYSVGVTVEDQIQVSAPISVTVVDNVAPSPNVLNLPTLNLSAPATITDYPTASDNCRGTITATTTSPLTFTQSGTYTIIWNYNDGNGNTLSQTQQVIVVRNDVTPPVLNNLPTNITVNCASIPAPPAVTAVDDVDGAVSVTYSEISTKNADSYSAAHYNYTITRTWSAIDGSNNSVTASQTITVIDNLAPVFGTINNIVVPTANNTAGANVNYNIVAVDACNSPVTYTYSVISGSFFPIGTATVEVTARDIVGNAVTRSFTVQVVDNQFPTITAPAAVTVNTDLGVAFATGVNLGTPTVTDNSLSGVSIGNNAPSQFPLGETIVTWTATDAAGNTSTATQVVLVQDVELPVLTVPATVITVTNNNQAFATNVSLGTATATDNSGTAIVSVEAPNQFPIGETTVKWTAIDPSGNTVSLLQLVIVQDKQAPSLVAPPNKIISTNAGQNYATGVDLGTASGTDNSGLPVTVSYSAPSIYNLGENEVVWTVTDAFGNTTTGIQIITVNDTEAPVISGVTNIVVDAPAGSNTAIVNSLGNPTASDNVGLMSLTNNATSNVYPIGTTSIIWEAKDAAGNITTGIQLVIVRDATAPVLNGVPADVTVSCGTIPSVANVTATDNNDQNLVVTFTESSTKGNNNAAASFYNYVITRTWTVTDAAANQTTATQTITVADTQAPAIGQLNNISTNSGAGICGATVNYTVSATDNCGSPITYTYSQASGTVFPVGNTTVTVTATDASGNSASQSFTVTVTDNQPPVITAPANISVTFGAAINLGTAIASDNCGTPNIGNDAPATFPIGVTIVTWTATDAAGNRSTAEQTVTVRDGIAPVLNGVPANINVSCSFIPPVAIVTATDNYDEEVVVTFTQSSTKGTDPTQASYYNYVINRTWTATDAAGNQTSATQQITVADTEAPVMAQLVNIDINSAAGTCGAIVNYTVSATDNCGSPITYTYSQASGTLFPVGSTIVTVTAKDASGNSTSRSFTVTVIDNQRPVITAPANITVTFGTTIDLGMATATDNCGIPTISNNKPATFPLGVTTVIWTATDAAGNTASATQTVTIVAPANCSSSITVTPENNTFTGGVPTNIYLGYGPQRVTLKANASGGSSYTYSWTAVAGNGALSSTTTSQPVFAPTQAGTYTFEVRVRTQAGCVSNSRVTICVKDIRVKGNSGDDDDDCEDDNDDDCDHKSHSSKDCKHKNHKHDCDHKSHSSKDCKAKGNHNDGDDDDCDHKSHNSKDCKHKNHKHHSSCDHKSHSSKDCKNKSSKNSGSNKKNNSYGNWSWWSNNDDDDDHDHDDDDDDNGSLKVYLCHVPPGNPNNPQTLRISINAVEAHLRNHPGDKLGSCAQQGCTETQLTTTNPKTVTTTITAEESTASTIKKVVPQPVIESDLEIKVMGNPSRGFFTIKMESKHELPVQIRIFDMNGRAMESKANQLPNSTVQIGHNLGTGTYYAEFLQGTRRKVVQLIKVR